MKKTVMIIDDHQPLRKLLSHVLGSAYHVIDKEDAHEAMVYFSNGNKADAIISDIKMPRMTGMEFLETTKRIFGEQMPPVMMLSSVENSAEKIKCLSHGAKDYMVKPFNPEELLVRLQNLMN